MAEYLGATLEDRLAQAKWYGDISINFVGTRENFEYVQGAEILPKTTRDDRRNSEVISTLWRVRLLSCGTASDATMMICHPQWYAEVMAANQVQPDERLSITDQLKGMRAFDIMSKEIHPRHGAPGASPTLPPMSQWNELQSKPGRGLLMPNGNIMPETTAREMSNATGMVILHAGIMEKLEQVVKFRASVDELVSMIAPERQPPIQTRLGPRVQGVGTAGNQTSTSQVRPPKPSTSGERRKQDYPQPPPASAEPVIKPPPVATPPETPPETTNISPKRPAQHREQSDLEEAGINVKDILFDEEAGEPETVDDESEDDCMIVETCKPMKREPKEQTPVPDQELWELEDPEDLRELGEEELEEAVDPTQGPGESLITAASVALKEEQVRLTVKEVMVEVVATTPPTRGRQVPVEGLIGPPISRGQSAMREVGFRVAGMSSSESGTNTEDEAFTDAASRRAGGNISPQDMDPDDIGGNIKWSRPAKRRKTRRKKKVPYTGIPYKQPPDDIVEEENIEEEAMDVEDEEEHEEEQGVGTAGNQTLTSQVRPPKPYKQPEDDVQDTTVNVPRLDLVGCPEFIEGHLSYSAPLPFLTPKRTCREPICLARQSWFEYTDYDDIEHHYYDTKTREQATRDSSMLLGTTYDLTIEGRHARKIYVFGSSSSKTNNATTNWMRLRDILISIGFFSSIAGAGMVSVDLEGFTTRAMRSYVESEELEDEVWKKAFTVIHMAAPNGVVIQVRVVWDGQTAHGQRIPFELTKILKDPSIRKIGFGIRKDTEKLASVGIVMESVCDMADIVLMAWPQMDKLEPKTGKMFVRKMLDSPCPLYAKSKDKPESGKSIRIDYEVMDFCKPVDQWHWHWSFYNAMDHFLAYALLDFLGARAADLDGLNMDADIVRYKLALLDAIRNLPDMGIVRRQDLPFAIGKNETDDERDLIRPWPIVKDSPIYNSLRARRSYTDGLERKHKLDLSHYSEGYLKFMEAQMESPMPEWDGWCKHGHSNWFNYVGKRFPHGCGSCGSFEHERDLCDSTLVCEYPYCRGLDHEMLVCPIIVARCGVCGGLGHEEHGQDSTVILEAHFNAAKHIHILASRLTNKQLAYKVQKNKETDSLEVVEVQSPYTRMRIEDKTPSKKKEQDEQV
jgi:hypothetical protein